MVFSTQHQHILTLSTGPSQLRVEWDGGKFMALFFIVHFQLKKQQTQMSCRSTYNSYDKQNIHQKLYDSPDQRNELFGYDAQRTQRLQQTYHNNYPNGEYTGEEERTCDTRHDVSQAPLDYYFDLRTNSNQKSIIGYSAMTPNLYNDNVLPTTPTIKAPNLYKNWEPFSTTPTPVMGGCYTKFIPHKPIEVAPHTNVRYWGADLNARMYERKIISSANEQPYSNWNRRQGLLNLVAENMPSRNDPYTKKIENPEDSFAYQIQRSCGKPPAVTSF